MEPVSDNSSPPRNSMSANGIKQDNLDGVYAGKDVREVFNKYDKNR